MSKVACPACPAPGLSLTLPCKLLFLLCGQGRGSPLTEPLHAQVRAAGSKGRLRGDSRVAGYHGFLGSVLKHPVSIDRPLIRGAGTETSRADCCQLRLALASLTPPQSLDDELHNSPLSQQTGFYLFKPSEGWAEPRER